MLRRVLSALLTIACGLSAGCSNDSLSPFPPGGLHVLFIGNSLTYYNDLPGTVSALALMSGDTIRTAAVTFSGVALVDHLNEGTAIRTLRSDRWDYVVLQQGPSSLQINRDSLVLMTQIFNESITRVGARTALFSVWPQTVYYSTFPRAIESYQLAAAAVDGLYLPVGAAWQAALAQNPSLPLYSDDGLHPTELGTYFAALVMYERFTGKDPRQLPVRVIANGRVVSGFPDELVRTLQSIAHQTNAGLPR